jgi:hypothetical protein
MNYIANCVRKLKDLTEKIYKEKIEIFCLMYRFCYMPRICLGYKEALNDPQQELFFL